MSIWPVTSTPHLPPAAWYVYKSLIQAGYECLLAGGWVRDLLMDCESSDVDLATSASPDQVALIFKRTVALGKRFGSVVVLVQSPDGPTQSVEVTSFRSDGQYVDGRRPSHITLSDAPTDAQRRDFTINGLFYDPGKNIVIDYVGGTGDLKAKVIRAIGDPMARFKEDRLRILRAVRFATRFGFTIEDKTYEAILHYASSLPSCVSAERIYQELAKMYASSHLAQSLQMMAPLGLLRSIFGVEEDAISIQKRLQAYLEFKTDSNFIYMLSLLWPLQHARIDPNCKRYLENLKISRAEKALIQTLEQLCQLYSLDPEITLSHRWLKWLQHATFQEAIIWLVAQTQDLAWKKRWDSWLKNQVLVPLCIENKPLFLARDLECLNLKPGKTVGRVLEWLFEQAARINTCNKSLLIYHLQSTPQGAKLLVQAKDPSPKGSL